MEDEFWTKVEKSEDYYRSIIKLSIEDPSYVLNEDWDLENIGHDAQFSNHTNIRLYAIELFGLIGAKCSKVQIETYLLEIENNDDENFEYELILAHLRVSTELCLERSLNLITSSPYFKTWRNTIYDRRFGTILEAIGESKSEIFLNLLHQLAEWNEQEKGYTYQYTKYVLHAIKMIGSNKSEETILSILESCEDNNIANQLLLTLGYVGDTKSISKLRDVIFSFDMNTDVIHKHLTSVEFACCSLGRLNDIESNDRMIEIWNNGYKSSYIARAFSLLKNYETIPLLIEGTGGINSNVVIGSLRALGELGGEEAKDHLLYLQRKGIIEHIDDMNPDGWRPRRETEKMIYYALLIVLDKIGASVAKSRLERARDYLPAIWEFDD